MRRPEQPAAFHPALPAGPVLGRTRALCPVCLRPLEAALRREGEEVLLCRTCPEHGAFAECVWRGEPALESWKRAKGPAANMPRQTVRSKGCPHDCGRCPEHLQRACTVLVEITEECNLRCPVCFADAGTRAGGFVPLETLRRQLGWIREQAGPVILQLSGGEPTLHPDLPKLVRAGRALFPAVQINTNGLRLAEDPGLAEKLVQAGLSWVFLQFDGTRDAIYTALRGRPLLRQKLVAVEACRKAGLGVVLVPTLTAGVNDDNLGELLDLALSLAPTVRGLHLQPMTTAGRNVLAGAKRLTLPETLMRLCAQSRGRIRPEHAAPPGCEHERCSFHCRYRLSSSGELIPLRGETNCRDSSVGAAASCCEPADGTETNCCDSPADAETGCCRPASGAAGGRCCPSPWETAGDRDGVDRSIETVVRSWGAPKSEDANGKTSDTANLAAEPTAFPTTGPAANPTASFDAFIAQARSRTFSITCMAFQDARTADLERLRGCCVHVFSPPDRLVPFCSYNLTAEDGTPLHRRSGAGA